MILTINPGAITRRTREQILGEIPDPGAGLNHGLLVAALKLKEWLNYPMGKVIDILLPIANERRGKDCTREVNRQVETHSIRAATTKRRDHPVRTTNRGSGAKLGSRKRV